MAVYWITLRDLTINSMFYGHSLYLLARSSCELFCGKFRVNMITNPNIIMAGFCFLFVFSNYDAMSISVVKENLVFSFTCWCVSYNTRSTILCWLLRSVQSSSDLIRQHRPMLTSDKCCIRFNACLKNLCRLMLPNEIGSLNTSILTNIEVKLYVTLNAGHNTYKSFF